MAWQGLCGAPLALGTLVCPRAASTRWRAGTARKALGRRTGATVSATPHFPLELVEILNALRSSCCATDRSPAHQDQHHKRTEDGQRRASIRPPARSVQRAHAAHTRPARVVSLTLHKQGTLTGSLSYEFDLQQSHRQSDHRFSELSPPSPEGSCPAPRAYGPRRRGPSADPRLPAHPLKFLESVLRHGLPRRVFDFASRAGRPTVKVWSDAAWEPSGAARAGAGGLRGDVVFFPAERGCCVVLRPAGSTVTPTCRLRSWPSTSPS